MTRPIPDSSIIAAFGWPYSVAQLVHGFRVLGTPTTAEHIESVWAKARQRGDIPPIERPAGGFDLRASTLVQMLGSPVVTAQSNEMVMVSKSLPPYAHGKTRSLQGGSSA